MTLGPKVEAKAVIVHPGQPLRALENISVKAQTADGTQVSQDIGGWVAMPPEHWDAIKRVLDKEQPSTSKP